MMKNYIVFLFAFLVMFSGNVHAKDLARIFQEGEIHGQFRTYYFKRQFDGKTPSREDIALGGMLYYKTAPFHSMNLGAALYTSQGLGLNDNSKDVYGLLAEGSGGNHRSFTAIGEIYLNAVFRQTAVKIGRQEISTPLVSVRDIRMLPQSFEAITISDHTFRNVSLFGAHITKIKGRTSTSFESMSEFGLGGDVDAKPVSLAGSIYTGIAGSKIQLWDMFAHDYMNSVYLQADYEHSLNRTWTLFSALQYLDQRETGDQIGREKYGEIDTWMYGVKAGFKGNGLQFHLAYTSVDKNGPVIEDWASGPQFSNIQVSPGSRAGERAILAKLAYDFDEIGLTGLFAYALFCDYNTPEHGSAASPDQNETDLNLQYTFDGYLKGWSVRARMALINQDEGAGGEDFKDYRFYLKYCF